MKGREIIRKEVCLDELLNTCVENAKAQWLPKPAGPPPNHKTLPIWVKRVRLLPNATPTRVLLKYTSPALPVGINPLHSFLGGIQTKGHNPSQ